MIALAKAKQNRGKWLILLIFILSCTAILPLSWSAIQAQRAQQKTMKALKQSMSDIAAALQTERCRSAVLVPAQALNTQAHNIALVFPRLSQAPGDFAQLSRALALDTDAFSAQAKFADCPALKFRLTELKKRCEACHEIFHPQAQPKLKIEQ